MDERKAKKLRKTNETEIQLKLNLDGTGEYQIGTGIPFFDHMLQKLNRLLEIPRLQKPTGLLLFHDEIVLFIKLFL